MIDTISSQVRAAAVSAIVFRPDFQDPRASPTFLGCAAQSIPITVIARVDFGLLVVNDRNSATLEKLSRLVVKFRQARGVARIAPRRDA